MLAPCVTLSQRSKALQTLYSVGGEVPKPCVLGGPLCGSSMSQLWQTERTHHASACPSLQCRGMAALGEQAHQPAVCEQSRSLGCLTLLSSQVPYIFGE